MIDDEFEKYQLECLIKMRESQIESIDRICEMKDESNKFHISFWEEFFLTSIFIFLLFSCLFLFFDFLKIPFTFSCLQMYFGGFMYAFRKR